MDEATVLLRDQADRNCVELPVWSHKQFRDWTQTPRHWVIAHKQRWWLRRWDSTLSYATFLLHVAELRLSFEIGVIWDNLSYWYLRHGSESHSEASKTRLFDLIIICMSFRVYTIKLEMLFQWLMSRMEKRTTHRSVGLFRTNTVKRALR